MDRDTLAAVVEYAAALKRAERIISELRDVRSARPELELPPTEIEADLQAERDASARKGEHIDELDLDKLSLQRRLDQAELGLDASRKAREDDARAFASLVTLTAEERTLSPIEAIKSLRSRLNLTLLSSKAVYDALRTTNV